MLDNTLPRLVFIRACIFLSRFAPFVEAILIAGSLSYLRLSSQVWSQSQSPPSLSSSRYPLPSSPSSATGRRLLTYATAALLLLFVLEIGYAALIYLPRTRRLLRSEAQRPAPLSRAARSALFHRCCDHIADPERYLRLWFLDADPAEIRRDNVRQFFLWAFFDSRDDDGDKSHRRGNDGGSAFSPEAPSSPGEQEKAIQADEDNVDDEMEGYLAAFERRLGRKLAPGRGSAVSFRLTIDPIEMRYRSVLLYGLACILDTLNYVILSWHGFQHHGPSASTGQAVFPPQMSNLLSSPNSPHRRSPSAHVGYWFRPHTSRTRRPVIFIHGVGIGLLPYTPFLSEIGQGSGGAGQGKHDDGGQVGILAIELLPLSSRLAPPLPHKDQLVADISAILAQHGGPAWDEFVLVSHSYGSVVTTHVLQSAALSGRVRGVVLVDPVSVLLHTPDVAYNFMRRPPQGAHGWQLWYLARTDPGVAEGLGRNFSWRESVVWKEELLGLAAAGQSGREGAVGGLQRKVAVCLTGKDLIIDSRSVARYLGDESVNAETVAMMTKRNKFVTPLDELLEDRPTDTRSTQRSYVSQSGIELLWSPQLDHAQIFERRGTRRYMLETIERYCTIE